jgi:hypothetical protein
MVARVLGAISGNQKLLNKIIFMFYFLHLGISKSLNKGSYDILDMQNRTLGLNRFHNNNNQVLQGTCSSTLHVRVFHYTASGRET